jgi:predicted nucleotide-binding protein
MKARASLAKIYGSDTAEVEFWCPRQSTDPTSITPQEKIASRLPSLERLLTALVVPANPRVFIGHGRSAEWLKLRIFLTDTLQVRCDEFNIEPTAGLQTANRIATMLASAQMAFLVMTAEDEHADGTMHARENVIHEIGLFQAKLGAERAIVMLEAGCSRFSNLDGLTTINFPRSDLLARSEDIRRVMLRERAIPAVA